MIKVIALSICIFMIGCTTFSPQTVSKYSKSTDTLVLSVPYTFLSKDYNNWRSLVNTIRYTKASRVILLWKGVGGRLSIGQEFINALENTHKFVVIRIIGPSFSMHALAACSGSKLEFTKGVLMFHLKASDGRPDVSQASQNENTKMMSKCLKYGIINSQDIQTVNRDKELWVYPNGTKRVHEDRRN